MPPTHRSAIKRYELHLASGVGPGEQTVIAAPGSGYALEILSAKVYNKNTAGDFQEVRCPDSVVFVGIFGSSKASNLERTLLSESDEPVRLPQNKALVWDINGASLNGDSALFGKYRTIRV